MALELAVGLAVFQMVLEAIVSFVCGCALARMGATYRFVIILSLFSLLLAFCFDPYVSPYFWQDQAYLVVSNSIIVLYGVVGWLFCDEANSRSDRVAIPDACANAEF